MRPQTLIMIATLSLAACNGPAGDPFARAGTWTIHQIADPADLVRGHGDGVAIGETAAVAIERLHAGKVRPLPSSGVAEIVPTNTGGAGAGAAQ
jgi:predicted RecA/RadA family phage recombinase